MPAVRGPPSQISVDTSVNPASRITCSKYATLALRSNGTTWPCSSVQCSDDDLLDVVGAHAKLSEPVNPVQDGARVAPVSTLRRNHACHHDRAHRAPPPDAAGARRTARTGGPTRAADNGRRDAPGTRVVVEPPQRGAREEQVLVPSVDGRFERRDGGRTVARVVAGVDALVGCRKMTRRSGLRTAAGCCRPC